MDLLSIASEGEAGKSTKGELKENFLPHERNSLGSAIVGALSLEVFKERFMG